MSQVSYLQIEEKIKLVRKEKFIHDGMFGLIHGLYFEEIRVSYGMETRYI